MRSAPIPIPQAANKKGAATSPQIPSNRSSDNLLSKSLGDYWARRNNGPQPRKSAAAVHRHVSDVSTTVRHAGYLLKRSNRVLPELTPSAAAGPAPTNNQPHTTTPQDGSGSLFLETLGYRKDDYNTTKGENDRKKPATKTAEKNDNSLDKFLGYAGTFFGVPVPHQHENTSATSASEDDGQGSPVTQLRYKPYVPRSRSSSRHIVVAAPAAAAVPVMDMHTPPPNDTGAVTQTSSSAMLPKTSFRHSSIDPPAIPHGNSSIVQDVMDSSGYWRAKYCVLENGVLYFYPNQPTAESAEAQAERMEQHEADQNASLSPPVTSLTLGQSPLPSAMLRHSHLWEKRVALDSVGAVRSAQTDYGKNAFELLAAEPSETGSEHSDAFMMGGVAEEAAAANVYDHHEPQHNKLVLRARSAEEMGEWLFQFHRSIALYVHNMMEQAFTSTSTHVGDLHHVAFQPAAPDSPARLSNTSSVFTSPRYYKQLSAGGGGSSAGSRLQSASPLFVPLSHGHGRNSLHRRRSKQRSSGVGSVASSTGDSTSAASGSPESPQIPFDFGPLDPDAESRIITPYARRTRSTSSTTPPSPWTNHSQQLTMPDASAMSSTPSSLLVVSQDRRGERERSPEFVPQSMAPEMEHPPGIKPGSRYVPPHLRHDASMPAPVPTAPPPLPAPSLPLPPRQQKYVPPSLRRQQQQQAAVAAMGSASTSPSRGSGLSLAERASLQEAKMGVNSDEVHQVMGNATYLDTEMEVEDNTTVRVKLGGCADPDFMEGSITDAMYVPVTASRLSLVHAGPFGYRHETASELALQWEIGAVSERGVRDYNEDSYLVDSGTSHGDVTPDHDTQFGIFAIFDGHCGNHAARYAAERMTNQIREEIQASTRPGTGSVVDALRMQDALQQAILTIDRDFCELCKLDGREWESGATALIATLVSEHLVIANLGDARGVISRSVESAHEANAMEEAGWSELPADDCPENRRCLYREVTDVHRPGEGSERARIEQANGWITHETEIPIGQIKRLLLDDEYVKDILCRCFSDRYQPSPKAAAPQRILQIYRVCGELAVSRAIGDRDFKSAFNDANESGRWTGPSMLPYPDKHSQTFSGDLVSSTPDFSAVTVGDAGVTDEFLLLACDGLWDVMDADDAVRVTRGLLYEKRMSAKIAAARLAELAMNLGSSDNITVILIRFY